MTPQPAEGSRTPPPLAPHVPLPDYYKDEDEHRAFLTRIFDDTAEDYERIESVMAFGSGPWYRRQALERAGLESGDDVLDVGIGTGMVAREALRIIGPTGSLVGVDPSPGMMGQVHLPQVELVQGMAEAIPRPDSSCDFVSMGYALRHIGDVAASFAEFFRVLRPGGRVCILEITKPRSSLGTATLKTYMRTVVPVIARVVARKNSSPELWRYYWDTIEACIPPATVLDALRTAGFVDARQHLELGMFSEYTATKPE
ncbi:class I SAM-dependent methyltransferase [Variovorax sp. J22R133]|uniref:class I SAM-dependent methyltransferase n=1 Tax=Variovorax brevis TaxID=3053503 RepID=UPI002574B8E7|nr:class I SAM-dependent methyltransferase [Variovorax sp. J22R133]MDM0112388.1 class I SAM-dependent methyltransferase [Variovorax sp. J22R133]